MTEDVLYRYVERRYSHGIDEYDNPLPGYSIQLDLHTFPVKKRTPKGAWINDYGNKRFVLLTAKKQYACNSQEEAKDSFIFRKKRHISILTAQLTSAKRALHIAENSKGSTEMTIREQFIY